MQPLASSWRLAAATLLPLLLPLGVAASSRSMTARLASVPDDGGYMALLLQGRIVEGDAARLRRVLGQGGFGALVLNSPGGSVLEARDRRG